MSQHGHRRSASPTRPIALACNLLEVGFSCNGDDYEERSVRIAALYLSAAFTLVSGRAAAQLGQDGEPIESSDFAVDGSEGAITGGTRYLGLAGAFVALAQGAEGVAHNPAAAALRVPYSRRRWDYGASIGFSFAGWLPETDFLNRGTGDDGPEVRQKSLLFGSLAANVYYRWAGFGVSAEARRQALERRDAQAGFALTSLTANYGVLNASLGYGFFGGQWVLGAGPRITGFSLNGADLGSDLVSVRGIGAQVGTVVKPTHRPWRIGVTAKSAVNPSTGASGQQVDVGDNALWRPTSMQLPWEVVGGVAYQFGPRPFNPPFVSVEQRAQAEAKGLGEALRSIATSTFGQVMLVVVAAGLLAYGAFTIAIAKYRRVRVDSR